MYCGTGYSGTVNPYHDMAIILSRVDYSERDRILTLLTAGHGKIAVIAKGVRASKSKLAGGIELFSESEIGVVTGRGTMGTLVSSRLLRHHGNIVKDLEKTNQAYFFLQTMYKMLEDETGQEYYGVVAIGLSALGDNDFDHRLVTIWFAMHVLRLSGHLPNLLANGAESFDFDYDKQEFQPVDDGNFSQNDLKILRLCAQSNKPPKLQKEAGSEQHLSQFATMLLSENH